MLASSFDSDTPDVDVDPPARGRQATVVQAAPPVTWDAGGSVPRNTKSRKFLVTSPTKDEEKLDDHKDNDMSFKSDWSNTRTHQNFLVDSIEIERKVNGDSTVKANSSADSVRKTSNTSSQQLSPYLSLPKQPPTMSIVQEGEFMFQEIDRDGDGVVSKIDLIKALKVNSPLAAV